MKVFWNKANIHGLGSKCQLKPGLNEVPDDVWEEYKNNDQVKALIKANILIPNPKGKKAAAKVGTPKPEDKDSGAPADESDDAEGDEVSDEDLEQLTKPQ